MNRLGVGGRMSSVTGQTVDTTATPAIARVEYGDDDAITPSVAVVEGIADLAGVEPVDLAPKTGIVLGEHIDGDALNTLVGGPAMTDVDISFTVEKYSVRVTDTTATVCLAVK